MTDTPALIPLTVALVSAYVGHNAVRADELPLLLTAVHDALARLGAPAVVEKAPPAVAELVPAVSVKKSVTPDFIICLDDGHKLKSLKRHLSKLGMTPDEYRAKWGLPRDYPMVAPTYAAKRSELAKASGLGQKQALAA